MSFYAQGVEIWCAPTADAREVHLSTLRHIAVEGRCFVLAANQVARAKDLSPEFATDYRRSRRGRLPWRQRDRQSVRRACSPGRCTTRRACWSPRSISAEVTRGRYDFDAAGHYSRPDIFTLTVDTRERHPVEWAPATTSEPTDTVVETIASAPCRSRHGRDRRAARGGACASRRDLCRAPSTRDAGRLPRPDQRGERRARRLRRRGSRDIRRSTARSTCSGSRQKRHSSNRRSTLAPAGDGRRGDRDSDS